MNPELLARTLYFALVDEARRNATSEDEHQLLDQVDEMPPAAVLSVFSEELFINSDLLNAISGALRHLDPPAYGEAVKEQEPLVLSDFDFLELVAFTTKCNNEEFWYAWREYGPRFESPDARALAADPLAMEALVDSRQGAVEEFLQRPDADERFDDHQREADRRRRAASQ
ncbi:hypothetical protein [Streptomyces sp. NPDC055912]|uniref:hypothetical protein n=1 Tax=Streptomyces sp. NPDC055912 TaxID=3345660 RepID=UPI0035DFC2CB